MLILLLALSAVEGLALAQETASDAELAVGKLKPADGLRAALFAAEPDVVNPVGIALDERGRVYLAETRRYNTAALYVLQHGHTYFDDLACRSVEDRVALARKWFGSELDRFDKASEVVKRLEDTDGDGKADRTTVLSESFRGILHGVASGVLARGDDVWVTSVPSLWRIRDGKTEELQRGFGVRFGNSGHDLHGLCFGPDGKIYFTMGDRGLKVGAIDLPDEGAVLRCNPDGSKLEVFARGLRNPQGLCFDAAGNLWTCDNNADMGDGARWLWLVEGGDYGWRVGYQYATDPWGAQELPRGHRMAAFRDGPWMSEALWQGGAAYVLPPSGSVTAGPTGMDFYPGAGRYKDHFVVGDFAFGIYSCAVKPKGAGFELVDVDKFLWNCWPTDAKFGPDGALYVADWVGGFPMTGKGRVFRVFDPAAPPSDTAALLAAGTAGVRDVELVRRLDHPDLRVRQAAQFELAARRSVAALSGAETPVARLHAVLALGQAGEGGPVLARLKDADVEVRAHAARLAGELKPPGAGEALRPLLADPSLRVRFFAIRAYARAVGRPALPDLLDVLRDPSNDDPFLRHAAVMGLLDSVNADVLAGLAADPARAVRLAAVVALRRLESPELRRFLGDPDPDVALEAARAINDVPIAAAMDDLAAVTAAHPRALLRAVNARFRRGTPGDAVGLADFALGDAPDEIRAEAALALGSWGRPSGRDRVTGAWRPLPERDPAPAREALGRALPELLKGPERVRVHALRSASRLQVEGAAALAEAVFRDPKQPSALRVEALQLLPPASLIDAASDPDVEVRREGIRLAPRLPAAEATTLLLKAAEDGPIPVRQAAIAALGTLSGAESERGVAVQLDRLLEGRQDPALQLETLEAAARKPGLKGKLMRVEASRRADDPIAPWREALEGGDAKLGRRNFFDNASIACLRCHTVGTTGGTVGPALTTVAAQKSREQLLEALLFPNREIAKGYGQEIVQTESGAIETGRIGSETASELVLIAADGREIRLAKDRIRARKAGLSAMPDDLGRKLSKRELRDLVAYLAGLK